MSTDTVKQMWATRPPRIPKDQGGKGYIAGVCEGIGVRYQIDPTIVRILFVVTSLAVGGGIAAYLLAWMCMPRYGLKVSPVQVVVGQKDKFSDVERAETTTGWILLICFILFSGLFVFQVDENWFSSSAIVAILLLLLAWFGLHQKEPVPPAGLLAQPVNPTPAEGPTVNLAGFTPADPAHQATPPDWDPLGTAPFAWDLPEPPPREQPQQKKSLWKWILIGLTLAITTMALLTAIAVGLFFATSSSTSDGGASDHHYISSERDLPHDTRSDHGTTWVDLADLSPLDEDFAATMTASNYDLEVTPPDDIRTRLICQTGPESNCEDTVLNKDADGAQLTLTLVDGSGDGHITVNHEDMTYSPGVVFQRPASEQDLQSRYEGSIGRLTVDLTELPPLEKPHRIEVDNGIGPVTVIAPSGPYEVRCDNGIGSTDCPAGVQNSQAKGELLTIEIDNGIGPITVIK